MSRRALERHSGPYEAAVVPRIAEIDVNLPSALVTEVEEAERGQGTKNASIIAANQRAMTAAIELADRLDAEAILAMHTALLGASDPDIAGKWRTEQVWIGRSEYGPHGAVFVPPHADRVPAAIDGLLTFVARHDDALGAYREGDPTAIVDCFVRASFAALINGRRLVGDLRYIRNRWQDRVQARRDATAWRIADLLLRHPVINASFVATELGIAPQNVYRSLQPLIDAGVVLEFTSRKRDQWWRAPDVLAALDAFAARAGRRQHQSASSSSAAVTATVQRIRSPRAHVR